MYKYLKQSPANLLKGLANPAVFLPNPSRRIGRTQFSFNLDQGKEIGERLDFAKMNSLEYLDMVIHETVRMHPTVPILWRVCTKTYHTEVRGKPHTIYKGEEVHIPTYTIHHDPDYYPDPERFDPKRFSKV